MAIQLYKAGSTHTVGGIECELQNFNISELDAKLAEGWFKSPSDINAPVEKSIETLDIETMESIHPVRAAAKDAGIDGWEKKRIGTLEAELKG